MADDTKKKAKAEAEVSDAESKEPEAETDAKKAEADKTDEAEPAKAEADKADADSDKAEAGADEADADEADADEAAADEAEAAADEAAADEADAAAAAAQDDADEHAELVAGVLGAVDEIDQLRVVALPCGHVALARIVDREPPIERAGLAAKVQRAFVERDFPLVVALYDRESWQQVLLAGDGNDWPLTVGGGAARARHIELLRGSRDWPRNAREILLPRARQQLKVVAFAQRSPELPPEIATAMVSQVLGDVVATVYALGGEAFEDDAFERADAALKDTPFAAADVALVGELRALSVQLEHYTRMTKIEADERFDWQAPIDQAYDAVRRYERHIIERLTTDEERARQKKIKWGVALAVVALVLVVGAWRYVVTRPIEPYAKIGDSKLTKVGAIVGTYYSGRRYNKRVKSRSDRSIYLNTHGSPMTGLGKDNWSVRWQGYLRFSRGGVHVLCGESDDGNRVWLNGKKIIDDWKVHAKTRTCKKVRVRKGWYKLRVDYFEKHSGALMRFLRGRRESAVKLVPARDFCCDGPADIPLPKTTGRPPGAPGLLKLRRAPGKKPPGKAPATKAPPSKTSKVKQPKGLINLKGPKGKEKPLGKPMLKGKPAAPKGKPAGPKGKAKPKRKASKRKATIAGGSKAAPKVKPAKAPAK